MIDIVTLRFYTQRAGGAETEAHSDLDIGIPAHFPFEEWHPEFRRLYGERLELGHLPVCCRLDDRLVHVSWCASRSLRIDEVGRLWQLPDGECCVYDVVTAPEARGRGIYPAVLSWIREDAARRQFRRVWIYAESTNHASERGILRAGFTAAGTIRALRVWKRPLWSFGTPYSLTDA